MYKLYQEFDRIDGRITDWMARFGVTLLRISLGVVFFWFGVLKFFPGLSPAQDLATRTMDLLTFGLLPATVSIPLLAGWECLIGLGLISGLFMRATLLLLFMQMLGTITPSFYFPAKFLPLSLMRQPWKANISSKIWFWSALVW
ncbi:MAG: hypothetical protein BroJett011_70050 [Chloroflexota bacterium]|nr:MAG: hypothetical protein BroJett011_70050 [Chloroflexota bacterium]